MILHVTKHAYNIATRTKMQAAWVERSEILTPKPEKNNGEIKNEKLTLLAFLSKLRQKPTAIIFHEQGTLHYIFIALFIYRLFPSLRARLVYDIHDIYNHSRGFDLIIKPSELAKKIFEKLTFQSRSNSIAILTVSNGLANYHEKKYGRRAQVVTSISNATYLSSTATRRNLVYFGAGIDLFPRDLLPALSARLTIDLYGKTDEAPGLGCRYVTFCGPYSSENLDFLGRYAALVVSNSIDPKEVKWLNTVYSLPNKFFQALSHGVPIIYQGRFDDAEAYFGELNGFLYKWNGQIDEFRRIIDRIRERRFGESETDMLMIRSFLSRMVSASADTYEKLLLD
jgi:glycosyltransferase involved in cell wall biosynthesis